MTVECFRGFAQKREFNLDSPFVLLTGANGRGKTSFFDAIEWALLGKLHRLTGSRDSQGTDYISNAFAGAGTQPDVELLLDAAGTEIKLRRQGTRGVLEVTREETTYTGPAAENELSRLLLRTPLDNSEFYRYLTRTHLLEQETILDFLRADKPGQRFDLMSRFLGLGVIRERVDALRLAARDCARQVPDTEKRVTDARSKVNDTKTRLEAARVAALDQAGIEVQLTLLARAQACIRDAARVAGSGLRPPADLRAIKPECTNAIALLDVKIKASTEAKSTLNSLLVRSADWESLRAEHVAHEEELKQAQGATAEFTIRVKAAQEAVTEARTLVAQWRERIRNTQGEQTTVAGFYDTGKKLARGGKTCPLCGQPVEYAALERHIEAEFERLSGETVELSRQLDAAQKTLTTAQESADDLSRQQQEGNQRIATLMATLARSAFMRLTTELERLGVHATDPSALSRVIAARIRGIEEEVAAANRVRAELEHIEAAADAASRALLVRELETQYTRAVETLDLAQEEYERTAAARGQLDTLYQRTKDVERDLVVELLGRYEEAWQNFYYRLRPHPFFTRLRLNLHQGENQELYFEASPEGEGEAKRANMIFSGGQAAGLMVVLFLTLHLHQNWFNLDTIMLDDPLQSMDDINVLGLIDLLRFFGDHRQVILATHDDRFATMLMHKFRPLEVGRQLYHYSFKGLTRLGPVIEEGTYAAKVSARESIYLQHTQ